MKPGNNNMLSGLIQVAVALIILCLCLEIPFLNDPPQHRLTLPIFHGSLAFSLIVALVILRIIAGRKRAQEQICRSLEIGELLRAADKNALRYKNLLECANDAIFLINADTGQLIEMNSKGGELFGYSRDEMGRLQGKDLVPVRDQSLYSALVRRLARRGAADDICITFKRKDGSRFLGEVSARLIESEEGKVAQAIVRDITLKRREDQEIRRRNRKLAILNSIIARVNQSIHLHKVLDLTLQETMDLFGADGGTIHLQEEKGLVLVAQKNLPQFTMTMGKDYSDLGHSCLMAASRQCITLLQGESAGCSVLKTVRGSGWQSAAGIPLFAGKRLVGIMHILSRCEREFVPDDVSFFTTMGNQLGIGIEHARMFEELNWKSKELLRSHRLLEKNSLQLKISRNRLEKNLALVERANMELEHLDMMKNHFIGMVSHEFKTPLTSILSGTEFLLTSYADTGDDNLYRLLRMIHTSVTRLNEVFNNLLKVAKLESNATSIAKTTLQLKEILDHVQLQLETAVTERGQRIVRQGVEDIPFISGNSEYLTEIFIQLLENAVKFTPDGGEISITARIADQDRLAEKKRVLCSFNQHFYEQMGCKCFVEVEVRDSGIGIDAAQHLKIFDKFYEIGEIRHHSSGKHKFLGKGTGLGLAIVKGMIEAHGGMIWVESPVTGSEECTGSAFFLLLPLEEDAGQAVFPFMHAPAPSPGLRTLPTDDGNISENQR